MTNQFQKDDGINDSIELMISILIRYPEINMIKTDPKTQEIIFSFLLKKKLTQVEFFTLQKELIKNIETFLFIQNKKPNSIRLQLQSYGDYSFVEVIRDFKTISQREISLLIHLISSEFGTYLLTEVDENQDLEDLKNQEKIIDDLLTRLQYQRQQDLIGFREAGKVMVFQKNGV
ncbi:hypothetical protein BBF96_03765 [Anoxybacter fermentans]|uniref:Uncharacterized protein n=1 Tax=Anoxybacter fermentans TaxID=1323375 RepID=A0A3S9SWB2_9FIRM|nr:hypothetical protein [Anoxybacter fermentans]AZR72579.1 hypothetical protein BBF96_03765 [Anoxybacter fermentans]